MRTYINTIIDSRISDIKILADRKKFCIFLNIKS